MLYNFLGNNNTLENVCLFSSFSSFSLKPNYIKSVPQVHSILNFVPMTGAEISIFFFFIFKRAICLLASYQFIMFPNDTYAE